MDDELSGRDARRTPHPGWYRRRWSDKTFRQKLELALVFGIIGMLPAIFSLAILWVPYELVTGEKFWPLVRTPVGILLLCAWCGTVSVFMAKEDG